MWLLQVWIIDRHRIDMIYTLYVCFLVLVHTKTMSLLMMPMEQQNPPNSTRATLRLGMSRPNVIRIPLHMVQQEAGSTARTALRDLWWFSWVKYFMEKHKLTDGLPFPPIIMEVKGNWYWRDPVSTVYVLFTSFRKDELKMFDFHLGRSYWTLTWCMKNDSRAMKGAMKEKGMTANIRLPFSTPFFGLQLSDSSAYSTSFPASHVELWSTPSQDATHPFRSIIDVLSSVYLLCCPCKQVLWDQRSLDMLDSLVCGWRNVRYCQGCCLK